MSTKRPYYKTKAEWAAAQAAQLRGQVQELRFRSSSGSYSKAARKAESMRLMGLEASRFERMAGRFRERGV